MDCPNATPVLAAARWCLGLPFAETAPLDRDDQKALQIRLRELVRRCTVAAFGIPASLFVPFALGLATRRASPEAAVWVFGIALTAGLLLGIPFAVMAWREAAVNRGLLKRDLEGGEVLVFRGDLEFPHTDAAAREALESAGIRPDASGGGHELRVLPNSRSVRGTGARGRPEFRSVRVQHAAPPPAYAWRVGLHDDLAPIDAPEGKRFEQRGLTPTELREIEGYIHELRRLDLRLMIPVFFFCVTLFSAIGRIRTPDGALLTWTDWYVAAVGLGLGPLAIVRYVRRVRLANGLRRDQQLGRAITAITAIEASAASEAEARAAAPAEFLPATSSLWTESGRPARWREMDTGIDLAA